MTPDATRFSQVASYLASISKSRTVRATTLTLPFAIIIAMLADRANPDAANVALSERIGWPLQAFTFMLAMFSPHTATLAAATLSSSLAHSCEAGAVGFIACFGILSIKLGKHSNWSVVDVFWPSYPDALDDQIYLPNAGTLDPRARAVSFVGRAEILQQLRVFAGHTVGEGVFWTTLEGVEGVGKTRLAIEWMLILKRNNWDVGILRPDQSPNQLRATKFRRNTAILLDADFTGASVRNEELWNTLGAVLSHQVAFSLPNFFTGHKCIRIVVADHFVSQVPAGLDEESLGEKLTSRRFVIESRVALLTNEEAHRISPTLSVQQVEQAAGRPLYIQLGGDVTHVRREIERRARRRLMLCRNVEDKQTLLLAALFGPLPRNIAEEYVTPELQSLQRLFEGYERSVLQKSIPAIVPAQLADEIGRQIIGGTEALAFDRVQNMTQKVLSATHLSRLTVASQFNSRLLRLGRQRRDLQNWLPMIESLMGAFDQTPEGMIAAAELPSSLWARTIEVGRKIDAEVGIYAERALGTKRVENILVTDELSNLISEFGLRPNDKRLLLAKRAAYSFAAIWYEFLERFDTALEYVDLGISLPDADVDRVFHDIYSAKTLNVGIHAAAKLHRTELMENFGTAFQSIFERSGGNVDVFRTMTAATQTAVGHYKSMCEAKYVTITHAARKQLPSTLTFDNYELDSTFDPLARSALRQDSEALHFVRKANQWLARIPASVGTQGDIAAGLNVTVAAQQVALVNGYLGDLYGFNNATQRSLDMVVAFPNDANVAIWAAGALGNAVRLYGDLLQFDQLNAWGTKFSFVLGHLDNRHVAYTIATASTAAMSDLANANDWLEMERWGSLLQTVTGRHPKDDLVAWVEAAGANNALIAYRKANLTMVPEYQVWVRRLANVARARPNNADIQRFASALSVTNIQQSAAGWPYGLPN